MGFMMLILVIFGFFAIEFCIVDCCAPEFKGTYDENQDEMLAHDWSIDQNELHALYGESENFSQIRQPEVYCQRLSDLKCVYEEFILKNHQEIVEIVESKIYLAGNLANSEDLMDELLKYIKHVAVYKTIRSVKELQKLNPISLNEPFPEKLFPLIEKNFHELQEKYEKLKRMKFGELKQD